MTDSKLGPAQRRIVDHLKRVGACTTGDLAGALDVTTQAVRPPLAELESKGLVAANPVSTGVRGRPPLGWALTPIAIDLFPDRHSDLTVELLDAMKSALGEDALEKVLLERDRSQLAAVEADMPDGADIATRVEVLAAARCFSSNTTVPCARPQRPVRACVPARSNCSEPWWVPVLKSSEHNICSPVATAAFTASGSADDRRSMATDAERVPVFDDWL